MRGGVLSAFLVACLAVPVTAQNESDVPEGLLLLWAENAIPLDEFVAKGYGMSEPADATSDEWCPYQAVTVSLGYADTPQCRDLLAKMKEIGRID
ncbi:hypothetical protein [Jannaschia marina]|uniref:hypothetical protein n=1 Tax=Jannaschia marina TaxID=2741674 RepID=UPI0015CB9633|nr:hypothetical protein [Jannaschia marina]